MEIWCAFATVTSDWPWKDLFLGAYSTKELAEESIEKHKSILEPIGMKIIFHVDMYTLNEIPLVTITR